MRGKNGIIYALGLFVVLLQVQLIYMYSSQEKMAIVDVEKVFESFEMKKELEIKLNNIETRQSNVNDSIQLAMSQYRIAFDNASDKEKPQINNDYMNLVSWSEMRKAQMNEELQRAVETFDRQIWNQLNSYLGEYGKTNNYTIVIGKYNHSVVSNNDLIDKTNDAIQFVNKRYQGN